MWINAIQATKLAAEVPEFVSGSFAAVRVDALAYRVASSLESIESAYIKAADPDAAGLDLYVLRVPEVEQPPKGEIGAFLHFEPVPVGRESPESYGVVEADSESDDAIE